jgi:tripartite-type tricarboxylate transporter receptor subunit TctC
MQQYRRPNMSDRRTKLAAEKSTGDPLLERAIGRRKFLDLTAGVAALPAMSRIARAQSYPTRPVRIIVGFPAGGPADIGARLIGHWLSQRLERPFVIDNRPGAASNIALEAAVRGPPDGYTLFEVTSVNAINATLYENVGFNLIRDIVPVASIIRSPNIMDVNPSFPAGTVPEFIAYAKANPGKINMASSGMGSTSHVSGALFKMMAGIDMVHVPYRGASPALTDLLGGRVQVMFDPLLSSIGYIRANKLRVLAVTTAMRSEALPDIPSVGEFLPGYEASSWLGLAVPKNTSAEIADKLNKEVNAGLADPKLQAMLADLGGTPLVGSPAEFGELIAREIEKWAKVIKFAGIKSE